MPKQKIAIIGAGNAGCITALHFYFHGRDRFEIEIYHSPYEHPIEKVGQGTTLIPTMLISSMFGSNWYDNNIGATLKSGILYEGWGKSKDEFFHTFPMHNMSAHYVPKKLSNAVLKSGLFKVKQQTINDPEKEIDADIIIDCRGRHNRDKDNYEPLINPLNACLLCRKEGRDNDLIYTRTVATPDGWTFVVPNQDSTSYGYLYNNKITSKEEATYNMMELFDVEPDGEFSFNNYIAKSVWKGERTILNGNMLAFLEPLEATSGHLYMETASNVWKNIIQKSLTRDEVDKKVHELMWKIETFVLWHYQNGSKYDTPFWEYAKSLPFNPPKEFIEIVDTVNKKTRNQLIHNTDYYAIWQSNSFKNWAEGSWWG